MFNSYLHSPELLKEAGLIPNRLLQVFLQFLESNGYSPNTIHQYLGAVLHFSLWQRQRGKSSVNPTKNDKADFINLHLLSCQCPKTFPRGKNAIAAALSHWFRQVTQNSDVMAKVNQHDSLVMSYDRYLREVAGLSPATRLYRCRYATEFLNWYATKPLLAFKSLTFEDLSSYISQRATDVSLPTTASIAYSLNSFIRFLTARGLCSINPTLCVPHPKLLYRIPSKKSLSSEEINQLYHTIDQSYPVGKRDYAIMRCLIDLGLRTSEVAGLRVNDIDWRNKVLTLHCAKLRRQRKLPVPQVLMQALIDYIMNARPKTQTSSIFVYHRAPVGHSVVASTIRGVARRAFAKAGFPLSQSQVHRLRYTIATRLLTYEVPVKTIADVLGHQCINTTTRYTYIHPKGLLTIALPWPGRTE